MDPIPILDPTMGKGDKFYIMKGVEKVYVGDIVDYYNERTPYQEHYELIGKSAYDPTVQYEKSEWTLGSKITAWEYVPNKTMLDDLSNKERFIAPDNFDFDNYILVLSYGRPIVSMEHGKDSEECMYHLIPTFAEEHEGNQVYFYQLGLGCGWPFDLRFPCYIMRGDEKIIVESTYDFQHFDRQ